MTTEPTPPRESKMLEHVRRWRREAYEADQPRSPEDRARHLDELLQRFGLAPRQADRSTRKEDR
ncbi:MAG: hypothetical protein V2A79_04100 [Planctomycetota bacterium]